MTHLIRESSPISVNIFFASLYNHFCFFKSALDSYLLWFIIYDSSSDSPRWSLRKFPIVAYVVVTNQSESWLKWDWHYPIKIHYSTRLVENPKFALNTAPHQTQLFRQNNGPIKILNEWQAFHSIFWLVEWFIQWEELKAFFSSSSLSFTVQSLSIPTGAIRLIHIWAIQWVIFITQSLTHQMSLTQKLFFQILFKNKKKDVTKI